MVGNRKMMFMCALAVCVCIGPANTAYVNDNCKNVRIIITNNRAQEIKVTRLLYFDYDVNKWRSESTWTAFKIAPGLRRYRIRNLEHVKDDQTKVKIYWRFKLGGSKWSAEQTRQTGTFVCHNDCAVELEVN